MLAERKPGLDLLLARDQAQLLEPLRLDPRRPLVADVAEGCPAPERERAAERRRCFFRPTRGVGLSAGIEQALEAVGVELLGCDLERVAAGARV